MRTLRYAVRGFMQGFIFMSALAGPLAAEEPKRPRLQPVRTISVRVMPEAAFFGREEHFRISTLTETSCTVQVDEASLRAQGEPLLMKAFRACLTAKPEAAGCRTVTFEDGSKARVRILKGGGWDQAGCDQSKVQGG
jgi:hypothetical protein